MIKIDRCIATMERILASSGVIFDTYIKSPEPVNSPWTIDISFTPGSIDRCIVLDAGDPETRLIDVSQFQLQPAAPG